MLLIRSAILRASSARCRQCSGPLKTDAGVWAFIRLLRAQRTAFTRCRSASDASAVGSAQVGASPGGVETGAREAELRYLLRGCLTEKIAGKNRRTSHTRRFASGDDPLPSLHGHYPASTLLRSSPPLAGASVLSASRFEPLVPCMGLSESSRDLSSPPLSFFRPIPLFDRGDHPFVPTRTSLTPARAEAVKVGHRTNLTACPAVARPHLDSFEPDGTLGAIGMTIRGEPAFGRGSIAPQPCIRWVQGP
jgi:hypothetical protein